jgi:hypothetical protein
VTRQRFIRVHLRRFLSRALRRPLEQLDPWAEWHDHGGEA